MKQIKVAVKKRGEKEGEEPPESACVLKSTLERLKKKGLNPMQMSQKLTEHGVSAPDGQSWNYELVVAECKRLKV
ncbi:MAG: hypothetical protein ACR2PT_12060 [Endozoicomonas sp.]